MERIRIRGRFRVGPRLVGLVFLTLVFATLGCSKTNETQDGAAAGGSRSGSAPATPPAPPAGSLATTELSAAHILIMHEGSQRRPEGVTRTRDEALALAQTVARQAQAPGADFAALAREYSNGPSAPDGGDLGVFPANMMIPKFSAALLEMEIGDVSDPVETEFGFHIILRKPVQKASARHILVMYAGSERAGSNITRTKEEAYARAQEALARVRAGEPFEALAAEYSDGPSAPQGGDLGEFHKGAMTPAFDAAVFACDVGSVTDIVETPFGYHIISRYK